MTSEQLEKMIDALKLEFPDFARDQIASILKYCCFDLHYAKRHMRELKKRPKNDKWIQLDLELTEDDDLYNPKIGGGNSGGLNF